MVGDEKFEAYDVEGNPIDGLISPEEIIKQQEDFETNKKVLEENQSKLEKLEKKDFDYKKLRDMTDDEKAKYSAAEMALRERQEALEEDQQSFRDGFVKSIKDDVIKSLAGDDDELAKKMEINYGRIKDSENASSREDISRLMSDAYGMSADIKSGSPLNKAVNSVGNAPIAKSDGPLTPELKDFGKKFGLTDEDMGKDK